MQSNSPSDFELDSIAFWLAAGRIRKLADKCSTQKSSEEISKCLDEAKSYQKDIIKATQDIDTWKANNVQNLPTREKIIEDLEIANELVAKLRKNLGEARFQEGTILTSDFADSHVRFRVNQNDSVEIRSPTWSSSTTPENEDIGTRVRVSTPIPPPQQQPPPQTIPQQQPPPQTIPQQQPPPQTIPQQQPPQQQWPQQQWPQQQWPQQQWPQQQWQQQQWQQQQWPQQQWPQQQWPQPQWSPLQWPQLQWPQQPGSNTFPSTTGEVQNGNYQAQPATKKEENHSLKRTHLIPKFDGKFDNFIKFREAYDSLIHNENIQSNVKLLVLKQKLLPEPLGVISGIKSYEAAYNALVQHYSNTFSLRAEITKIIEALPKAKHQWDINTMKKNLIIVKEKYAVLRQDPRNQAYLGAEFLSTLVRKFPIEIAKHSDFLEESPNRIDKYMSDLDKFVNTNQRVMNLAKYERIENKQNPSSMNLEINELNQANNVEQQRRNNNYQRNNNDRPQKCIFCSQQHQSKNCRLSIKERKESLNRQKKCAKCLKNGHKAEGCLAPLKCFACQEEHPFILCEKKQTSNQTSNKESSSNSAQTNAITLPRNSLTKIRIQINKCECLALFDSGSTNCVMSEELRKKLNLKLQPDEIPVKQATTATTAIGTVMAKVKIGITTRNQLFFILPGL
ncbi:hypothetical protein DERF_016674 [Dermatophagoides farinae]|uniref:Peptidase A2 domain-containing protein n=1 Tax=Dermatophagoides farinae TaxID=6954 RepID=A0A922HK33_DERFA|nr:hypothetical protein DERF_016674 [Dermatophagoides farinae]